MVRALEEFCAVLLLVQTIAMLQFYTVITRAVGLAAALEMYVANMKQATLVITYSSQKAAVMTH